MNLIQYINKSILAVSFLLGPFIHGQIPPKPKEKNPIVLSTLYNYKFSKDFVERDETTNSEDFNSFLSYFSHYVDFYTIFNFDKVSDQLEEEFKFLDYRSFDKFCSLRGIRNISFYNYFLEKDTYIKQTLYFNKDNLLDHEMTESIDIKAPSKRKILNIYYYEYQNSKGVIDVKKFSKGNSHQSLLKKYSFSEKDKKLLEISIIDEFGKNKTTEFCYDKTNKIEEVKMDGIKTYARKDEIIDLNTEVYKQIYPWLSKEYWSETNGREENIGVKNLGKNYFKIDTEHSLAHTKSIDVEYLGKDRQFNSKLYITTTDRLVYRYHKFNIANEYTLTEKDYYKFDKNNNLIFSLLIDQVVNNIPYNINSRNTPNIMFFIIRNDDRKNIFRIKHLMTFQSYIVDVYDLHRGIIQNNIPALTDWEYSIELNDKKGLNEVFLLHNNKKYPLLTIN